MPTVAELLSQAQACHRAGRLPEAVEFYEQALRADSANSEAHYLLGITFHGLGQSNEAIRSLSQAIRLDPDRAEAHNYLGAVLGRQGKLDEAILSFQQAQLLSPESAEISGNLKHALAVRDNNRGNALAAQGKRDEAVSCYRRALQLKPDYAEAHHNLGTVSAEQDQLEEAVGCHRRALALRPDFAEAHNNLGAALVRQEKLDEAVACFRRALELKPDYFKAHNNLGAVLVKQNKLEEAAACCRRALELRPDDAEARGNLGAVLAMQDEFDEAVACYRRALELNPDNADMHNHLGAVLAKQGKLDQAAACFRRALELRPGYADAHNNLGLLLTLEGSLDEAIACFRQALEIQPRFAAAHSNSLIALQYQPGITLAQLAVAHGEFDERHAAPLQAEWRPHDNRPDSDRKLRLGFVSADLGCHPVGYTLIRVLENLDKRQAEIICYSDHIGKPAIAAGDQRHQAEPGGDEDRADQVDIAFDMAGHTGNNRLLSFARKPAPIQFTWYGYVGTTGLKAMDYLLADRFEVPADAERYIQERVLRMPDGYACYDPPSYAPPVAPLPALARGYVTFGSFNNLAKITPHVVEVWASILRPVSGARLVLKYRGLDAPSVTQRFAEMFARHGIYSTRLELRGGSSHADLLRQYQGIDVALDPFPYSGGITTCEALWMGVPVVTCPGETFASRHSLSHLSNIGLTDTIADDLGSYVAFAVGLAGDLPRLAALRARLRDQVAASPLCDGKRFAENLMHVVRGAWRAWCGTRPG